MSRMEPRLRLINCMMHDNPLLMICPGCGDRLKIENETARSNANYYIAERNIKCNKCGLKIRQYIYILRG